jgi:hypothetical protein
VAGHHRARTRWLDRLYRLPNPFDTLEGWRRAMHLDLVELSPGELENERIKVRLRLAYTPDETWLHDRLKKLRAAQHHRGRR